MATKRKNTERQLCVLLTQADCEALETVRTLRFREFGGRVETASELVRNLIREEAETRGG